MLIITLLIGLAAAFNFIILIIKYKSKRYIDLALDVLALIILTQIFGNTILGMLIATVASMLISLYLLVIHTY